MREAYGSCCDLLAPESLFASCFGDFDGVNFGSSGGQPYSRSHARDVLRMLFCECSDVLVPALAVFADFFDELSSSMMSSTAFAAALASGFPPKVVPCDPAEEFVKA